MKHTLGAFCCTVLTTFAAARAQGPATHFEIDTDHPLQTMDGFGASDAWSMQNAGLWPDSVRKQTADWLFSTRNDRHGQPLGIGLSIWRFNIGTGSAAQGRESGIGSRGMRTECFLNPDGTYDWTRQEGQRLFLRMARQRGVTTFIGFFNSPPVYYTQNGLATNTGRDGTLNLKAEHYDDFADFAAQVAEGLVQHDSIRLNYICPVNEPDGHWNWVGPKQEGSPATNREIARLVRAFGKAFASAGLDTKILVNESSDYRCMFSTHMTDWQRGHSIQSFFCPDSTDTYIGDVPNVPHLMAGHSYWTDTPLKALRNIRVQLKDTLDRYGVQFWQTETCIMGNDTEIGGGGGFDRTMKTALYVARIIHHDIAYAGAKSWQWWRAVGGDYKDGLLREYGRRKETGPLIVDSKLLWALGNYSRFVRPGAVRMDIEASDATGRRVEEGDTDRKGLMCTAYRNTDGTWVMVVLNYSPEEKTFTFRVKNQKVGKWQPYLTAEGENVNLQPQEKIRNGKTARIPARSLITFVGR
ncbi:MAG: xylanase [Paraprevotella sp.]|nr:xylanase [Paraprevotella sp.]